jgi:hypothetical protein
MVLLLGFSLSARDTNESQPSKDIAISFYGRFNSQVCDVENSNFLQFSISIHGI